MDKHMSQVVWFGGLPIRRGDMITYMDEVAKSQDKDNWFRIREAGVLGNYQFNEQHGYPPEGTTPLSLAEFRRIVDGEEVDIQVIPAVLSLKRKPAKKSKPRAKKRSANPTSLGGMRR